MNSLRERIEARLIDRIQTAERVKSSPGGKVDLGPLMNRLDDVIKVVEGIKDYSVEPYRERIREIICSTCRQDGKGQCVTRTKELCGLDKYLDTIIAVIEQELKQDHSLPDSA